MTGSHVLWGMNRVQGFRNHATPCAEKQLGAWPNARTEVLRVVLGVVEGDGAWTGVAKCGQVWSKYG